MSLEVNIFRTGKNRVETTSILKGSLQLFSYEFHFYLKPQDSLEFSVGNFYHNL